MRLSPVDKTIWISLAIVAAIAIAREAWGQEKGPGDYGFQHQHNHDWYKDLKNPITGYSCCNGTANGVEGDCRPTRAYKVGNLWKALIDGEWFFVPPEAVIESKHNKEPFQAHICASRARTLTGQPWIYCLIEKEAGG